MNQDKEQEDTKIFPNPFIVTFFNISMIYCENNAPICCTNRNNALFLLQIGKNKDVCAFEMEIFLLPR